MEGTKLYIGNIRHLNEDDIREAFEKYGRITDLWLAQYPSGFGFLSYETPEQAEQAIRDMDGNQIRGSMIKVELAKAPKGEIRRDRTRHRDYRRSHSYSRRRRSRSRSYSRHHRSSRRSRDRSSSYRSRDRSSSHHRSKHSRHSRRDRSRSRSYSN